MVHAIYKLDIIRPGLIPSPLRETVMVLITRIAAAAHERPPYRCATCGEPFLSDLPAAVACITAPGMPRVAATGICEECDEAHDGRTLWRKLAALFRPEDMAGMGRA